MSNSANCFAGLILQEQSSTSVEDVFLYSGVQKSSESMGPAIYFPIIFKTLLCILVPLDDPTLLH